MIATTPCPAPGAAASAQPPHASHLATQRQVMGARFRFRSNSRELLYLVDAAYGGLPPHRFPWRGPRIEVGMWLGSGAPARAGEPPAVRTRLDAEPMYGVLDEHNHVVMSPRRRRARLMASAAMLERPYHLRYELLEFAVFILAARCQGLVPLHAACLGRAGRGILVLGASGAGKSTLVLHGLLQGLELLAEDAVFVHPGCMLATGVANFLHVQADALDGVDAATRAWISRAPVIRRRSGVRKFEVALAAAPRPVRLAPAPLQLVGTVLLSGRASGRSAATLARADAAGAAAALALDQAHAMSQPGWRDFQRRVMQAGIHVLHRGHHPASSVDVLRQLLD